MNNYCEVYVGTVTCDIRDGLWVWFPTVVHSLLMKEDGRFKVVYSEKNKHTLRAEVTEMCDNYKKAFEDAKKLLDSYTKEQMKATEDNIAKIMRYTDETKVVPTKRKVYDIDLNKETKCDN